MNKQIIKPLIIYQMDPFGEKIGGIQTFLRSFIKYAPEDFEISFAGVTSNPKQFPINRWNREKLFNTPVNFFPVLHVGNENIKSRIPLSLKFTLALFTCRRKLDYQDKILEFHRLEPSLPFGNTPCKKIMFVHNNMKDCLNNPHTEFKFKHFPWLYFRLEDRQFGIMDKLFTVREDTANEYKKKYASIANRISFIPTWVDEEVFFPLTPQKTKEKKQYFLSQKGFSPTSKIVLFVGRLDGQKDPVLLINAFSYLITSVPEARLIIVGTGSLENKMREQIARQKLTDRVIFLGTQPPERVAELMKISDILALTSAFEGMPITVLEALGSGLPVVSTDVGEIKRVVKNGLSGILCRDRNPETLGEAMIKALRDETLTPRHCVEAIQNYTAKKVLKTLYDFHYTLVRN